MPIWLPPLLTFCGLLILAWALRRYFASLPYATDCDLTPGSGEYQEIAEALFAQLFWQDSPAPHTGSKLQAFCFLSCEGRDPPAALLQRLTRASLAVKPRSMLEGEQAPDWYDVFRTMCGNAYFCASFDKLRKLDLNQVSVEVGAQYGPTFGSGDLYEGRKEKGKWVFKQEMPLWIS